jgi:selenocysteine-specific elongation factor
VTEDIAILTAGTALEGSPVVPVSVVSGRGLDVLKAEIGRAAEERHTAPATGHFRLPVDRVFVLQGHGLVVTGTARAGTVRVGDWVRCLPGAGRFRVRSLQVHGRTRDAGTAGERVALNLGGAERSDIARGHVISADALDRVSSRFDARLELPPTRRQPLANHQRVRVHLGTAERLGKLTLLGRPGRDRAPVYCQIRLEEPVQAMRGDRFVLRDSTAEHTIGGGVVMHPWAPAHRRKDPHLDGWLRTLDGDDAGAIAAALVESGASLAMPVAEVSLLLNRTDDAGATLATDTRLRLLTVDDGVLCTTAARWQRVEGDVRRTLAAFHAAHPLVPGIEMEELRSTLPFPTPPKVFRAVLDALGASGIVLRDGSAVRLPDHTVALKTDEQQLAERIMALLVEQPLSPPDLPQLETALGLGRARLLEIVRVLERNRSIVRVATDLYVAAAGIERLKSGMAEHFLTSATITPAEFRDRFGTSRKYAIPLLEYCDREGLTVRQGDVRRPGRASSVPTGRI